MDPPIELIVEGAEIVHALEKKMRTLSFAVAVSPVEQQSVKKLYDLLFAPGLQRIKKRAQGILRTVFQHSQELFVLCGLATTFTQITNQIKTDAGVSHLLTWYDGVNPSLVLRKITVSLLLSLSQSKIQQDPESTSAVDSQIPSPSRSSVFDLEPNRKRARTNTGLTADSGDIQSQYRTIVERLYPTRDIQSLLSLSRDQLISLLDSSRQDLPSHASSPDLSKGSHPSVSSREEARTPEAGLIYQAYPSG
jgi:hypothetical protein